MPIAMPNKSSMNPMHGKTRPTITRRRLLYVAILLGLACTSLQAMADRHRSDPDEVIRATAGLKPDLEEGKRLYNQCAICHTPEGWGSQTGRYPQLAGQHQSVLLKQLADIQKGNRDNPTMIPFTQPLFFHGPQTLVNLTAYIQQLRMVPNNSIGHGLDLAEGKQLYDENCKKCHGDSGEGKPDKHYPRIQGQHYQYLLRQMQWLQAGKRRNGDTEMIDQIKDFNHSQLMNIADYISRMAPDKDLVADRPDWKNPDFRQGYISAPR